MTSTWFRPFDPGVRRNVVTPGNAENFFSPYRLSISCRYPSRAFHAPPRVVKNSIFSARQNEAAVLFVAIKRDPLHAGFSM
jgi:hypothetical protein